MSQSVLIIDAEEGFAGQLAATLRDHGLEPHQTGDGKLGMDLAKQEVPQAIVLCVELPRMSGYSICAKLKKDAQLKSIPLIITSAEATPETFEHHKKLKTRAEEYLKKPFPPSLLMQVLERYIQVPKKSAANGHDDADDLPIEDQPVLVLPDDEAFSEDEARSIGGNDRPGHQIDEVLHGLAVKPAPGGRGLAQSAGVQAQHSEFDEDDEVMTSVGLMPQGGADEALIQEIEELKAQLQSAKEAQARAERERNEAKANEKAAMQVHTQSSPPGASAAREVLALKKELNAKDKEILELRDKVHAKDREALEQKEREMELEAKVVQAEEEKAQADGMREVADQARQQAEDRAQAADQRAQQAETKAQAADGKAIAADRRAQQADRAAKEAEQRSKEANERAAQADQRSREADAAREAAEQRLAETEQELERQTTDLNRRLGEAAAHEAELDGALQSANQDLAQLREVIAERDEVIAQGQELAQTLRAANQAQNQEITRLNNELQAATAEGSSLRDQLQASQQMVADLEQRIQGLETDLSSARGENDALRTTIQELEHDREVAENRIARAYQKIRDDEKIKGKARKAIEIALALLQESGYAPEAEGAEETAGEGTDEARS